MGHSLSGRRKNKSKSSYPLVPSTTKSPASHCVGFSLQMVPNDLRNVFQVRQGSPLCLKVWWGVGWEVVVEKMSLSVPFVISTHEHEPKSCVVYFGFLASFLMVRMLSRTAPSPRGYMNGCSL